METKLPTVAISSTQLTLNRILTSQVATATIKLNQSNLKISAIGLDPDFTKGAATDKLDFDVDLTSGEVTCFIKEGVEAPKNGTYAYTYWVFLEDGTMLGGKTFKVVVSDKVPAPKLQSSTLKLNGIFTEQTASTKITLDQTLPEISGITFVPVAKEGTPARTEAEKIQLDYVVDAQTNESLIQASVLYGSDAPKNGNYDFQYAVHLVSGEVMPAQKIRVNVHSTVPSVKLASGTAKLNKVLGSYADAKIAVSLTNGAGYTVKDMLLPDTWENGDFSVNYDPATGELLVALENSAAVNKSYTVMLTPVVYHAETQQEVLLPVSVKLTVQIYSAVPKVSVSASGKLDTVNPDSVLTYTVSKASNIDMAVDGVGLEGEDQDLFNVELVTVGGKPAAKVTLIDGETYATNKTYKLQLIFSIRGQEIPVSISFKVSQSSLKFAAVPTVRMYQFQSWPVTFDVTLTSPTGAKLEDISLSSKTAAAFLRAVGGSEMKVDIAEDGRSAKVTLRISNPGYLVYGKSYTVYLDVTPENNASNQKPTQLKLTILSYK